MGTSGLSASELPGIAFTMLYAIESCMTIPHNIQLPTSGNFSNTKFKQNWNPKRIFINSLQSVLDSLSVCQGKENWMKAKARNLNILL